MKGIDLNANIIPNESLGNIKLRSKREDILDLLAGCEKILLDRMGSDKTPVVAVYKLANNSVEIAIDERNSKIFRITSKLGYTGLLFDKISVGMKVRDVMVMFPDLYYHEGDELLLFRNVPGVSLDVNDIDPPPEIVPDLNIDAISVYAEEAVMTPQGQRGNW